MAENPINNERVIRVLSANLFWLAGEPVHNGQYRGRGECAPDFSCCEPDLMSSVDVRIKTTLQRMKEELIENLRRSELGEGECIDLESQELIVGWIDRWFEDLIFDTVAADVEN